MINSISNLPTFLNNTSSSDSDSLNSDSSNNNFSDLISLFQQVMNTVGSSSLSSEPSSPAADFNSDGSMSLDNFYSASPVVQSAMSSNGVQSLQNLGSSQIVSVPTSLSNPNVIQPSPQLSIESFVNEMSSKYQVPSKLINSIIRAESNFNPNAVSPVGAMGLMQLMPSTAKSLGVQNAFDPKQNIEGGVKYLKQLIDKYGDLKKVVAAYNAGPGNVDKYGGIPPFAETQNYVRKVLGSI